MIKPKTKREKIEWKAEKLGLLVSYCHDTPNQQTYIFTGDAGMTFSAEGHRTAVAFLVGFEEGRKQGKEC